MAWFDLLTNAYDIFSYPVYSVLGNDIEQFVQPEVIRTGNDWRRKNPAPPTIADGCETINEMIDKTVNKYGHQNMLGVRSILSKQVVTISKKQIIVKELADTYTYSTFNEVKEEARQLANGFQKIGIKAQDRVIMFLDTRREWAMCTFALFDMNSIISTLYSTLGDQGVISGVNQTEATYIVTNNELLPKLIKLMPQMNTLKHVIVVTDVVAGQQEELCIKSHEGITIHRFDLILEAGKSNLNNYTSAKPEPEDIAVIMFTSGSTGDPKGVILSHQSFVHGSKNLIAHVSRVPNLNAGDSYVSYLPMAHILEFLGLYIMIGLGFVIHYATPITLVKGAPGLKAGCLSDFEAAQPQVVIAVPLMVDRIKKAIESNGKKAMGNLFDQIMAYKRKWNGNLKRTPLIDSLLLGKAKGIFGGKLKCILSGGAPLAEETQLFCRDVLGVCFAIAWAATETCGTGTLMEPMDRSIGRIGIPVDGALLRLQDWEEGGYTVKDKPNPRGEVLVCSKSLAVGYYKNPKVTAEAFITDEDGKRWWVSGDIVEVFPDGSFKIIDRKKDLVKLQFGEYISLGKIEAELKGCPIVDNICVIADSFHSFTGAIILPNMVEMKLLLKTLGKKEDSMSLQEICDDADVTAEVLKQITATGKSCNLVGAEVPKKVHVVPDQWSQEEGPYRGNGLLTAAMKIRRKKIMEVYDREIKAMFSS